MDDMRHTCRLTQIGNTVRQAVSANGNDPAGRSGTEDKLAKVSQEFESLLLGYMLKEMRATVPESGLFPASMTEDIFTDMLDQQLSVKMARHDGLGISRMVFNQLHNSETVGSKE
ncbi:MAG: hypothetical protein CR984_03515 [Proteobacteria bacterium]|nr:MAG: hypothetical protein CR984_03515 [Pseudomonadota bacterium]PIE67118.1 MAG: hypothetical protein CSA23_05570 [Deltaproteobacteria bacterium]